MSERSAPVSLNEREKFMDALRGFAILGIFIANLIGLTLYDPTDTTKGWHFPKLDKQMLFLQHLLSKVNSIQFSVCSLDEGWHYKSNELKGSRATILLALLLFGDYFSCSSLALFTSLSSGMEISSHFML